MLHTSCSDKQVYKLTEQNCITPPYYPIVATLPLPLAPPLPSHLCCGVAAEVEVKLCWMGDAHVHCGTRRDVATCQPGPVVVGRAEGCYHSCQPGPVYGRREEGRGVGGVNITADHSCHITFFTFCMV